MNGLNEQDLKKITARLEMLESRMNAWSKSHVSLASKIYENGTYQVAVLESRIAALEEHVRILVSKFREDQNAQ